MLALETQNQGIYSPQTICHFWIRSSRQSNSQNFSVVFYYRELQELCLMSLSGMKRDLFYHRISAHLAARCTHSTRSEWQCLVRLLHLIPISTSSCRDKYSFTHCAIVWISCVMYEHLHWSLEMLFTGCPCNPQVNCWRPSSPALLADMES